MLYQDVFAADGVELIIAPIVDFGYWIGCVSLHCHAVNTYNSRTELFPHVQYFIVATSEFVTIPFGPTREVGSLATTCWPLSVVQMNARLKPPSLCSQ